MIIYNKYFVRITIIIIISVLQSNIYSQNFNIVTKSAEIDSDNIIIKYDFTEFKKNQVFNITINIRDSSGKKIITNSLSGDVGNNIKGGGNKEISWNFMKDRILINDEISIEIFAELSTSENTQNTGRSVKAISPFKTSLSSALIPGLGINMVNKKKVYLGFSLLTYGALGTSFYFKKKSDDNFNLYLNDNVISSESEYFKLSEDYKKTSNILLYSAIGSWAINMIWTTIATSKYNKSARTSAFSDKVHFDIGFDPGVNCVGFSLLYNINK
jgi:hypothetical protein